MDNVVGEENTCIEKYMCYVGARLEVKLTLSLILNDDLNEAFHNLLTYIRN